MTEVAVIGAGVLKSVVSLGVKDTVSVCVPAPNTVPIGDE